MLCIVPSKEDKLKNVILKQVDNRNKNKCRAQIKNGDYKNVF